jgi:NTE family protein
MVGRVEGGTTVKTVAIACQGGGSHTAFTGGVLQRLLADEDHRVVALSGTSGGAVCALLAWYGLLTGGAAEAGRLLERFWEANAATTLSGKLANAWLVGLARLEGRVTLPTVSPYLYPDVAGPAFTDLLTHHVDVDRLARLQESPPEDQPLLLVGAVDVLSGDFKAFSSRRQEITVDAVLASAAVPLLFRAVEVGGRHYWDGLFSQNPPVRQLPDAGPDEIWVIRINPRARATEPKTVGDIADRRNELAGNLSLEQELHVIRKVNGWVDRLGDPYRRIEIREIDLDLDLDLPSKLDRRPAFLRRLFDEGREQADAFLAGLPG